MFLTQIIALDEDSSPILYKENAFYWKSIQLARFWWHFLWRESVRIFAFGWQPIDFGFLPRKNEVLLLAFPWSSTCLQTYMKTPNKQKTQLIFALLKIQTDVVWGLLLPVIFIGIKSWMQYSKLKLQNPHLKINQLIWVWNSLFFWGESIFFRREFTKTHEVHKLSLSQRTSLQIQFVRRWKKREVSKKSYRKTTQILSDFLSEEEGKKYSCSSGSAEKKSFCF